MVRPFALPRLTLRLWLITDPYWFNTRADYGSSDRIRHSPHTFLSSQSARTAATNPGHGTKIMVVPVSATQVAHSYVLLSVIPESPLAARAAGGVPGLWDSIYLARSLG